MTSNDVQRHYDGLLGAVYTRELVGGEGPAAYDAKVEECSGFFSRFFFSASSSSPPLAIDLGCGGGVQSIALAKAGFRVVGVDVSKVLLAEAAENVSRRGLSSVELVEGDICAWLSDFRATAAAPSAGSINYAQLVVCLTDTILHLPSREHVRKLFCDAAAVLCCGGKLVISFRDLVAGELRGADRFLLLSSSPTLLHSCFVETVSTDLAAIHDVVYDKQEEGGTSSWRQRVSVYYKLRLSVADVVGMLEAAGLSVEAPSVVRGMVTLVATKI